jgi:hypothetical protein
MLHAKTESEVTSPIVAVALPSSHLLRPLSPMASPRHSRSSSSRFSNKRSKGRKGWQEIDVIGEEEERTTGSCPSAATASSSLSHPSPS